MAENKAKREITLDDLALMVQNGFMGLEDKMGGLKRELKSEILNAKTELKSDMEDVKVRLNKRVDIFTHKDLEFRVERLEEKVEKHDGLILQTAKGNA